MGRAGRGLSVPLVTLLGGQLKPIKAYNSNGLGIMPPGEAADEAGELIAEGFRAIKIRLGRPSLEDDLDAVRAVRKSICSVGEGRSARPRMPCMSPTLIVVAILFSFGHGVSRPPLTSIITQNSPPDQRGVFGAMTSIESLTRILGPVIGGFIITQHPKWLGWVGGALFTIAVTIAMTIKAEPRVETQSAHGA